MYAALSRTEIRSVTGAAGNADFSVLSANAAVKAERGNTALREDKAIAGWRLGKRLAKGVAVYFDGSSELRTGPMKTRA